MEITVDVQLFVVADIMHGIMDNGDGTARCKLSRAYVHQCIISFVLCIKFGWELFLIVSDSVCSGC